MVKVCAVELVREHETDRFYASASRRGISAAAGPVAVQTGNPTVIRLGTNASDDITPLLWAQTSSIFTRAGLKVEITHYR